MIKVRTGYVSPVGTCCGQDYYTWQGWLSHRRRWHRKPYAIKRRQG